MIVKKDKLSISFLKTYVLNQSEYKKSDAMLFGSLVDCLVYEPEKYEKYLSVNMTKELSYVLDYLEVEWKDLMIKIESKIRKEYSQEATIKKHLGAYESCCELFNKAREGITLVDEKLYLQAVKAANKIKSSIHWRELHETGTHEYQKSIECQYEGLYGIETLKGILDHFKIEEGLIGDEITIIDLKTSDKTIREFLQQINTLRYDLQGAFYIDICKELFPNAHIKFKWLVYSKVEDKTAIITMSEQLYNKGIYGESKPWKKELGYIELINIYQESISKGYKDFDLDYNKNNGYYEL